MSRHTHAAAAMMIGREGHHSRRDMNDDGFHGWHSDRIIIKNVDWVNTCWINTGSGQVSIVWPHGTDMEKAGPWRGLSNRSRLIYRYRCDDIFVNGRKGLNVERAQLRQ